MPKAKQATSKGQEPKDVSKKKLTEKQNLFIWEYLRDFNATKAAIRAGYSEKTAYSIGEENLKKPEIHEAIQKIIDERKQRLGINQERVIRELESIAFSRINDYLEVKDGHVNVKDTSQIDFDAHAAIESYSETVSEFGNTVFVKMHSKTAALTLLSKLLRLFEEDKDAGKNKSDRNASYTRIQDALLRVKGR